MQDLTHVAAAIGPRYTVERELGAGGMATVYLAEDTKHARRVAIKVLRPELAATLGVERFHREIRVAARLQHPNIIPLLDSGEGDGLLYFVMPFVEGESLRHKLARAGELPVEEAVRLLVEITDALAYAHKQGVVHRDIKPDNVLISGRHALVMDFGVAKAVSDATETQHFTTAGVALGTPAYMSPEQATAGPVDHRADIYALGCLAYELLTGHVPFRGATPQETLNAHVTKAPVPLTTYRAGIPSELERIVLRCLRKRPADRFQSADELLHHLDQQLTPTLGMPPANVARRPRLVLAVSMLVVAAAAWVVLSRPTSFAVGKQRSITTEPGIEWDPAISPDGRTVAYAAGTAGALRIHVRQAGGQAIRVTPDSGPSQRRPVFSPDGTQLLYSQGENLFVAPVFAPTGGGSRRIIATAPGSEITSAVWSRDGRRVAYIIADSIYVRSVDGDDTRRIIVHHDADALAWSPDGRYLAFTAGNSQFAVEKSPGNDAPSQILTLELRPGAHAVAITDRSTLNVNPVWLPDGKHLLFIGDRDGPRDVYSVAMRGGRARGDPQRLTTGLQAFGLAVSSDGRELLYSVLVTRSNVFEFPVLPGRATGMADARQVTSGNQLILGVAVARDGKWLYFDSDRLGNDEVFRQALPNGEPEQLTRDPAMDCCPSVSPDGRWVAFHSVHFGTRDIFVMPAAGGSARRVTSDTTQERHPFWSPDGTSLAYTVEGQGIFVVKRQPDGTWSPPQRVLASGVTTSVAVWGADGRLLLPEGSDLFAIDPAAREGHRTQVFAGHEGAIVFLATAGGEPAIFMEIRQRGGRTIISRLEGGGGSARVVVNFDDPVLQPERRWFATDGHHIFITLGSDEADVQIADLIHH